MSSSVVAPHEQLVSQQATPQRQGKTPVTTTTTSQVSWSESDDALLREGVEAFGPKRWREIAAKLFPLPARRSAIECRTRWRALTENNTIVAKHAWTRDEDALLTELVAEYDRRNWSIVASQLVGRNAKQCRERWHNQLRPDLSHAPWTDAEDAVIIEKQRVVGNKWAAIACHLPGRTDNMVKNRWHATLAHERGRSPPPSPLPPCGAELETLWRKRSRDDHGRDLQATPPKKKQAKKKTKNRTPTAAVDVVVNCVAHVLVQWKTVRRPE